MAYFFFLISVIEKINLIIFVSDPRIATICVNSK